MRDIVKNGRLEELVSDLALFKETVDGFMAMFDREVYDCILATDRISSMFAAVIADRMGRCVVLSPDAIGKRRVIIMSDSLGNGQSLKECAERIESEGGEVLRIGCIVERKEEGARKSKILRPYPFEALVEI
ncbi:MAG: hypothetical protein IKN41_04300 [Candidatus Methanomethylophilaceae archaeon]|nr:hypothetical protein [Candidatus Methanomethylophilaceae archaeon]